MLDQIVAASRCAAVLPFVKSRCTVTALTAKRLLERRGFNPYLVLGGTVEHFHPHLWVEVDGHPVDTATSDSAYAVFLRGIADRTREVPRSDGCGDGVGA